MNGNYCKILGKESGRTHFYGFLRPYVSLNCISGLLYYVTNFNYFPIPSMGTAIARGKPFQGFIQYIGIK